MNICFKMMLLWEVKINADVNEKRTNVNAFK